MIPCYSVGLDGKPWASWSDPNDPRHRISEFIRAEIHLSLDNADDLLCALSDSARAEHGWEWHGNSHSLRLEGDRCFLVDHYPHLGDEPLPDLELGVEHLAEAIRAWKEFVRNRGDGVS